MKTVRAFLDGALVALCAGACFLFALPWALNEIGLVAILCFAAGSALPSVMRRLGVGARASLWVPVVAVTVAFAARLAFPGVVARLEALPTTMVPGWGGFLGGLLSRMILFPSSREENCGKAEPCSHAHGHAHAHGPAHAQHHAHGPAHARHHAHAHGHAHAQHPAHGHAPLSQTDTRLAAMGTLVGVLVLLGVGTQMRKDGAIVSVGRTFWFLLVESAPALLLGFMLAGLVPLVLSSSRVASLSRGSRAVQALKGVGYGLPLPVCSCGVLPLYESLVRRGVPLAAALAFFVATPELGVDAILLSLPLLGLPLTVARVLSAFVVAWLVGILVGRSLVRSATLIRVDLNEDKGRPLSERLATGLRFGFGEVFDHTMPWIAVGLLVAAVAEPLLSHGSLSRLAPAVQVPLAALFGVPMYVCASGATPLVALAVHKGVSSGAALAFLIAGPATNVTTFAVLTRLHGKRLAITFGLAVIGLATVAGYCVDLLGVQATPILDAREASGGGPLHLVSVGFLALLTTLSLLRQGPRGALRQISSPLHSH